MLNDITMKWPRKHNSLLYETANYEVFTMKLNDEVFASTTKNLLILLRMIASTTPIGSMCFLVAMLFGLKHPDLIGFCCGILIGFFYYLFHDLDYEDEINNLINIYSPFGRYFGWLIVCISSMMFITSFACSVARYFSL